MYWLNVRLLLLLSKLMHKDNKLIGMVAVLEIKNLCALYKLKVSIRMFFVVRY